VFDTLDDEPGLFEIHGAETRPKGAPYAIEMRADEAALDGKKCGFILDEPYRWESWAAPKTLLGIIDHNKVLVSVLNPPRSNSAQREWPTAGSHSSVGENPGIKPPN
jgi:hypothetical protein